VLVGSVGWLVVNVHVNVAYVGGLRVQVRNVGRCSLVLMAFDRIRAWSSPNLVAAVSNDAIHLLSSNYLLLHRFSLFSILI